MGERAIEGMIAGRLAEWLTSSVMVVFAIVLALPGDTLATSPGFDFLTEHGITETMMAVPTALIGGARLMALYINGSWRQSPMIRAIGSALGASMFGVLSISLLWPTLTGSAEAASTGFGTYAVLALFEILAAYRSGHDARVART